MNSRTVRVFFSSTFRDFAEERDLLVRRVFPSLRARLKDRFVELIDVDLRWGITAEQAERGEVLPICLAEIDRSRPYFVGMLGDRYGWVPAAEAYPASLVERHPWLERHQGGKSVTELEILHGVLNDPAMAGRAFFYFRCADYANKKGGDYVSVNMEDASRQSDLKNLIRNSGFYVVEDYPTPEFFAERLEADLWEILDEAYPLDEVPESFERVNRQHNSYATPRRRLYLGGERYISWLNKTLESNSQRILITGASGGGKSALIANWLECYRKTKPKIFVFEHYTGASADAADPVALVRRLIETIKRKINDQEELPGDPEKLLDSLPLWLANASTFATKEGGIWVFVLDALNGIFDRRDLRWFPEFLPERIHFVASCLLGDVHDALVTKGQWISLIVDPLKEFEAQTLLTSYLARYNKTLPAELTMKTVSHPLATNPLFLRTLAEELRLFGVHEQLAERLGVYLTSKTIDDLFEQVLQRVENDCGVEPVRLTMEAIWASRAGLTEQEILGVADLVPATWASIRFAFDDALLETNGRITFAHDYLRIAVSDRYFAGNNELSEDTQSEDALLLRKQAHTRLAQWFERQPIDARAVEEIPYQWLKAKEWNCLKYCLTDRSMFEAIYINRSHEELLNYWLILERKTDAIIEREYTQAWEKWKTETNLLQVMSVSTQLLTFLLWSDRPAKICSLMISYNMINYNDNIDNKLIYNFQKYSAKYFYDKGFFYLARDFLIRNINLVESGYLNLCIEDQIELYNYIGNIYDWMEDSKSAKIEWQKAERLFSEFENNSFRKTKFILDKNPTLELFKQHIEQIKIKSGANSLEFAEICLRKSKYIRKNIAKYSSKTKNILFREVKKDLSSAKKIHLNISGSMSRGYLESEFYLIAFEVQRFEELAGDLGKNYEKEIHKEYDKLVAITRLCITKYGITDYLSHEFRKYFKSRQMYLSKIVDSEDLLELRLDDSDLYYIPDGYDRINIPLEEGHQLIQPLFDFFGIKNQSVFELIENVCKHWSKVNLLKNIEIPYWSLIVEQVRHEIEIMAEKDEKMMLDFLNILIDKIGAVAGQECLYLADMLLLYGEHLELAGNSKGSILLYKKAKNIIGLFNGKKSEKYRYVSDLIKNF